MQSPNTLGKKSKKKKLNLDIIVPVTAEKKANTNKIAEVPDINSPVIIPTPVKKEKLD